MTLYQMYFQSQMYSHKALEHLPLNVQRVYVACVNSVYTSLSFTDKTGLKAEFTPATLHLLKERSRVN